VPELSHRDRFILEAVHGWLLLNNPAEARRELASVSADVRGHPEVLLKEWEILAHEKRWDDAVALADRIIARAPETPEGCIKKAYALHELKRTQEAWDCLHPLSSRFFDQWIIPYNLACYACQLGRKNEALVWLRRAFKLGDEKQLRTMALEDPDLTPLREEIARLAARS
jgi:predicted Zn-dependent protease